ncbi:MAG: carbon-nitrogen family hydrolase [Fusobacterium gastrosuis]|uniref:carbon-nitrogen family hydrolase n=1 Tax=Fusobacterium gastrosuis TaxID=1755100 RepID=UPI002A8E6A1C|nr:carbon-nitrogen family hydrolase [Fusobacterium gastrosuis]
MKICLLQMDMEFEKNNKNYQKVEKEIKKMQAEKLDVIVLPETWSTGFFPKENLEEYSEKNGNKIREEFSKLALRNDVNIIGGSIVNKKDKGIYNTSFIFNRKGECIASYDKIHLFSPMNEDNFFKSGNQIVTFELDGILCGIIICYDLRFLELIRTLALKGIKILFVVAQWPESRIEHWKLLNRVRAIENQIFVVAVNSCGKVDDTIFGGHSLVVDPWGEVITELSENEEFKMVKIDLNKLNEIRNKMSIFNDRKPFLYKIN